MTETELPEIVSILKTHGACYEAEQWSKQYGRDHAKAWSECRLGDWMIWIIVRIEQPKQGSDPYRKLVGCLAEIAAEVLPIFEKRYPDDHRPRQCIATLKSYTAGNATIEQVKAARKLAAAAAAAADPDADAAVYAAAAAYADAYAAAAYAAAAADAAAAKSSMKQKMAEIVREHYPEPPIVKVEK